MPDRTTPDKTMSDQTGIDSKSPSEEPEVIEGVAIERGEAAADASSGGPADRNGDGEQHRPGWLGAGWQGFGRALSWPLAVSIGAVLVALTGVMVQEWRATSRLEVLRAEVALLASRLDAAESAAIAAQEDSARNDAVLSDRLAGLETAMPDDRAGEIGALTASQGALEQRVLALESDADAESDAPGGAAMQTGSVLAQSGLTVANAMIADSLAGADAARWLPVLDELRAAGLPLGEIGALRRALSPPPPSTSQLLAEASALVPSLRASMRAGSGDWWSATTDMLAGFVTLRRKDDVQTDPVPGPDAPVEAFESGIQRGQLGAALAASGPLADALADVSGDGLAEANPDPVLKELASWRIAAERRLAADEALAGFTAAMAALLARTGTAGKAG